MSLRGFVDDVVAAPQYPAATTIRPSMLAAVDVTIKVIGAVAVLTLSVWAGTGFGGGFWAAVGFILLQAASFLPALIAAVAPAVQIAFTRYIVDAEGITVHTQILQKSQRRVPWEKVTAVRQRRTFIDAVLRIERVDVIAYGTRGATLHLVGLRDAGPLRDRVAAEMRRSASVESLFRGD